MHRHFDPWNLVEVNLRVIPDLVDKDNFVLLFRVLFKNCRERAIGCGLMMKRPLLASIIAHQTTQRILILTICRDDTEPLNLGLFILILAVQKPIEVSATRERN